ncbi:hypothetical protein [Lysinibacillus xylanilyticus]|uniref:Resolvase/invertase-type recombinase catalytic domain-containing protein n=1 Tax=Lysinibacillus xylanilyticus TaxID=582475 RepID=A0ABT4EVR1_9BACI|nr:hypothetical protein [Lysinibacillus xylanilyticus]MCY9549108.1 hypothetical protein [Lysinibacillus xylanilyticus]
MKTASTSHTNNEGLVYGRVSNSGTLDTEECWHVLVTARAEFGVVLRAKSYYIFFIFRFMIGLEMMKEIRKNILWEDYKHDEQKL